VSTAFNSLWNDIEVMREAQRKKAAEQKEASGDSSSSLNSGKTNVAAKCMWISRE
jgi:hypothetical protein